jgi:hypothetical protein
MTVKPPSRTKEAGVNPLLARDACLPDGEFTPALWAGQSKNAEVSAGVPGLGGTSCSLFGRLRRLQALR